MLLWIEWGAPRSTLCVECDVCTDCRVPAEETTDIGRERERVGARGGRGRAGE